MGSEKQSPRACSQTAPDGIPATRPLLLRRLARPHFNLTWQHTRVHFQQVHHHLSDVFGLDFPGVGSVRLVTGPMLWMTHWPGEMSDVQVVDLMGRVWPVRLLSSPVETKVGVDVAGLPAGVYYLNLRDGNGLLCRGAFVKL